MNNLPQHAKRAIPVLLRPILAFLLIFGSSAVTLKQVVATNGNLLTQVTARDFPFLAIFAASACAAYVLAGRGSFALLPAAGFLLTASFFGLGAAAAVAILAAAAFALGALSLKALRLTDGAALKTTLGLALIGLAIQSSSQFKTNTFPAMLAVALTCIFAGRRELYDLARQWRVAVAPTVAEFRVSFALIAGVLILTGLYAAHPDSGFDPKVIHLRIPEYIAAFSKWDFDPGLNYSALMPKLSSWLMTFPYLGGGLQGAKLTILLQYVLLASLIWRLGFAFAGRRDCASAAALAFVAIPVAFWAATIPMEDVTLSLMGVAAATAVFGAASTADGGPVERRFVIGCVFFASALSTKVQGAYFAPLGLFAVAFVLARGTVRQALPWLALGGTVVVLFGGYGYVRAFAITGNPLYPFSVSGGLGDPRFVGLQSWDGLFRMISMTNVYSETGPGSMGWSPLLIALGAVFALIVGDWRMRAIAASAIAGGIAMFMSAQIARYQIPFLALAAPLLAFGLTRLRSFERAGAAIVILVSLAGLLGLKGLVGLNYYNDAGRILRLAPYTVEQFDEAMRAGEALTAVGEAILVVDHKFQFGAARLVYSRMSESVFPQADGFASTEALREFLAARQVTLLVETGFLPKSPLIEALLVHCSDVVFERTPVRLRRLRAACG